MTLGETLIRMATEREEFVTGDDGYTYYWPEGSPNGCISATELRLLADELDRRNEEWDRIVKTGLAKVDIPVTDPRPIVRGEIEP